MQSKPTSDTIKLLSLIAFIDAIGFGVLIPVLPDLLTELGTGDTSKDALLAGLLLVSFSIVQVIAAPVVGTLSDRFGRRPILLLSLLGFMVDYLLMAISHTLPLLFLARILSGLFGATYVTIHAAITDITTESERTKAYGWIGAAEGSGFIIGPMIGAFLGQFSTRAPFYFSAFLVCCILIVTYRHLPETIKEKTTKKIGFGLLDPTLPFRSIAMTSRLKLLIFTFFCISFATQSFITIWPFFLIESFDWSSFNIGISIAIYSVSMVLSQGLLAGTLAKLIGNWKTVLTGMTLATIIYICLGSSQSSFQIYIVVLVGGLAGVSIPALNTLLSKSVGDEEQGQLQGILSSTYGLTAILGPLAMASLFAYTTDEVGLYLPGAVYFLAAAITALAGIIVFIFIKHQISRNGNLN